MTKTVKKYAELTRPELEAEYKKLSEKYEEYKKIGKTLLNLLFENNKRDFLSNINIKPKENIYLYEDKNGDMNLYGVKLKRKK